jgi:hypothetical protein
MIFPADDELARGEPQRDENQERGARQVACHQTTVPNQSDASDAFETGGESEFRDRKKRR